MKQSPGVQESMCLVGIEDTFRNGSYLLRELASVEVSKESIRKRSEAMGAVVESRNKIEEEKYNWENRKEEIPLEQLPSSEFLYVSMDGAKVNTLDGWVEVKSGVVFDAIVKEKKPVRKMTTYLGSFEESSVFMSRLYTEAYKRGLDKAEKVAVIGDGAQWIWNESSIHFPGALNIMDYYHGTERIWTIGNLLYGDGEPEVKQFTSPHIDRLKRGQIESIIGILKRIKRGSKQVKDTIEKTIGYYENNKDKMRYSIYKRKGYFIGSGVVESSCKHLIAERLKGSGMRWSINGANSILQLRVCFLNNQWDELWRNYNRAA